MNVEIMDIKIYIRSAGRVQTRSNPAIYHLILKMMLAF